jgi:3-oxoacyl-[acyl-carrier-protein] synthase II
VAGGSDNGRRRVVITGVGMVTPLGNDPESTWESLVAGESGAGPITHFDTSDYDIHFACELKDFEPTVWIDRKQARRMDRFSQLALSAARMAEADSGLEIAAEPHRVGAAVATGIGGLYAFENCFQSLLERGPGRTSPFAIVQIIPNMAAAWVSMELGAQGPLAAECTACAASNMAIGDGLDAIRLGRADVMLCGGTEAPITRVGIAGFTAMRALSRRNDDPEAASRPFDAERDGFVMGEAAAMLVLEELEHARARGAKIYAEVLGYGVRCEAYHATAPEPEGRAVGALIASALAAARIAADEVDHVNAHGTATPQNDQAEARGMRVMFGERGRRIPVTSVKSMVGHCLAAAGAVEAAVLALSLDRGVIPPTIHHREHDPECDVDIVANEAREMPIRCGISTSLAFGGNNAALVMRRV